jgi:hypothetical protein
LAPPASNVAPPITDSTRDTQLLYMSVGEVESMTEDESMKEILLESGLVCEDPTKEESGRLWITESPDQFGLPLFVSPDGLPHGRIDLFECRAPFAANVRVASRWIRDSEDQAPTVLQQMLLDYARRLSMGSE